MREVLIRLVDIPIARILVLAGFIFILVGILGKIEGKIEPGTAGRISAAIIGALLLAVGVFMQYSELRYAELHEMNAKAQLEQTNKQTAAAPSTLIKVVSGTWGRNCNAKVGNITAKLAGICDGASSCDFLIDPATLEDPAPECNKDFSAEWKCGDGSAMLSATLPSLSGNNDRLKLSCTGQ